MEVCLASYQMPDPDVVYSRVLPVLIVPLQQHTRPWFRANPCVPPQPLNNLPCLSARLKNEAGAHLGPLNTHTRRECVTSSQAVQVLAAPPPVRIKGRAMSPAPGARGRRQGSGGWGTGSSHRRGSEWDTRSRQRYPAEVEERREGGGSHRTEGGKDRHGE